MVCVRARLMRVRACVHAFFCMWGEGDFVVCVHASEMGVVGEYMGGV